MLNVFIRLRTVVHRFFLTVMSLFDWKVFLKSTFLWLFGILVGFIPLFYKMILSFLDSGNIINIWMDHNIEFNNFSTIFLLLIETVLSEDKKYKKAVIISSMIIMLATAIIYSIMVFYPNWDISVPAYVTSGINSVSFFLVLLIGIFCLLVLSKR